MVAGMNKLLLKNRIAGVAAVAAALAVAFSATACSRDDDGPIPVSAEDDGFVGNGFFRKAVIDSGAFIHLASDTLYLNLDSLWSYSNCALKRIELDMSHEAEALVISPKIIIDSDGKDCPSPFLHPDTTLKLVLDDGDLSDASVIRIQNDEGRILDTALLRRGSFDLDTFVIYVDSLFDSVSSLPLRTKSSPSLLKVLDSLTPRVFYWRPIESECGLVIDKCGKLVNDTIFPTNWNMSDTVLVPIRKSCALGDSTYCSSTRWVDDSSSVGEVQERSDTLWHTSVYYVEEIPDCATMNSFKFDAYAIGRKMNFVRELMVPDESESACGPSALRDVFIYDVGRNRVFPDSLDASALYGIWKSDARTIK